MKRKEMEKYTYVGIESVEFDNEEISCKTSDSIYKFADMYDKLFIYSSNILKELEVGKRYDINLKLLTNIKRTLTGNVRRDLIFKNAELLKMEYTVTNECETNEYLYIFKVKQDKNI